MQGMTGLGEEAQQPGGPSGWRRGFPDCLGGQRSSAHTSCRMELQRLHLERSLCIALDQERVFSIGPRGSASFDATPTVAFDVDFGLKDTDGTLRVENLAAKQKVTVEGVELLLAQAQAWTD